MSPCPSVLLWVTLECRVAEASTVNGSRHSSLLFDDTQRDQEPTIGTQVDPLAQFDRPYGGFRSPDGVDCLVTLCAGGSAAPAAAFAGRGVNMLLTFFSVRA